MKTSIIRITFFFVLFASALACHSAFAEKPYDSEERERYWNLFLRTKTDSPSEEFELARELQDAGRNWRARRRFRAVVKYWPTSDEAPKAQLAKASLLDARGRRSTAFDAYQEMFDSFPGQFPVEKILERQFELAVDTKQARKFKFLFGGFSDPIESVEMFEKIIENAPGWRRAPNAQFLIGEAYEKAGKPEKAIPAYQAVELRFPGTPLAPTAAFRKCSLLVELSGKYRNDSRLRDKAYSELLLFAAKYPDSSHMEEVLEMTRLQYERVARAAFDIAEYYDERVADKEVAIAKYTRFIQDYPESKFIENARKRLLQLEGRSGD